MEIDAGSVTVSKAELIGLSDFVDSVKGTIS